MIRQITRCPGPTILSLTTIALGVGVNVGVAAVVYSVLLRPAPYADGSRVVNLGERQSTGGDLFRRVG